MKCLYCGKELSASDKYCDFCGAKVKEETKAERTLNETKNETTAETATSSSEKTNGNGAHTVSYDMKGESGKSNSNNPGKKKKNPWIIILVVCLVSLLISTVVVLAGGAAVRTVFKHFDFDSLEEFFENYEDYDFDDFEDFDDFQKIYDWGEGFVKDSNGLYGLYEGTDEFVAGKTDISKNTYSSEFGEIDFTLPASYSTYTKSDIADEYEDYGIEKSEYKNNLVVFDYCADNTISGATLSVSYYNKDYYSEYADINDYNEYIKDDNWSYEYEYDCTVSYADDSVITLDGHEYNQLAARITMDDYELYAYNFTREVGGYFMDITIITSDLDDIGDFITAVNANNGEN